MKFHHPPAVSDHVYGLPRDLAFPVGSTVDIPAGLAREIHDFWEVKRLLDPNIFDGELLSATRMWVTPSGSTEVSLRQTRFSHYLFGQANPLPPSQMCRSVAVNAVPHTSDGFFVLARMGTMSSFRGRIKFIGGAASIDDIRDGAFQPRLCLGREFREEVGLDLSTIAHAPEPPHLSTRPGFNIFNLSYRLELKLDKQALLASANFSTDDKTGGQGEVSELVFLEATDVGLAGFEQEFGSQCLDYVIPYLRVVLGQSPVRSLQAEMFNG